MWYEEIVSEFDVRQKIKHVVTDSASNIKKAFVTLPGFEVVTTSDSDSDEDEDEDGDRCSSEALLIQIEHHSCFAHILQLVVKDGLANAGPIDTVIKKCSKFVSFVRKSTIATDILQGQIRLQANNVTRWNSQLKMIKSVLSISSDILKKLSEINGSPPKLTLHDQNLLNDIVEILAPFEEATDFVQVGCIPSAGYVLPCIKGLKYHLRSMVTKYHSAFVRGLSKSLSSRMAYFEEKDAYIIAAILDPRFKLRWCTDDSQKQTYVDSLKSELEMITTSSEDSSATLQTREEPPAKRSKSLFSFMPSQVESSNGNDVSSEDSMYLDTPCVSMNTNPLTFWKDNAKKYPLLSRLAKNYLAIPSSSSPVERLFSIAGKIFRPERCQLTDNRFQQLMFIRCNNTHT